MRADEQQRLVLHIQDCGGQEVFLPVLDLLHAAKDSISMLVFKLPNMLDPALQPRSLKQLLTQLNSFAVHASNSPLLLVGTCKAEAVARGGEQALAKVSAQLEKGLGGCPVLPNVVRCNGALFFAVENEAGFAGDESIRQLVQAIEKAAIALPSMQQQVPLGWLAVYDRLQRLLAEGLQHLPLAKLTALAKECGLPHRSATSLEREVALMLTYFHSIGALSWFDLPELRELVILDPQWLIDAISMVIRDFELHRYDDDDSNDRFSVDKVAQRQVPKEFSLLKNQGILDRALIGYLWGGARFASHQKQLIGVMEYFGLLVRIRGKELSFIVPTLLPFCKAHVSRPSVPDVPLTCTLHFFLSGASHPIDVWSSDDLREGFLPKGAFDHLCGAAVGWTHHTTSNFKPVLGDGFALVKFGQHKLLLDLDDGGRPIITVTLLSEANQSGAPAPGTAATPVDRLSLLVSSALRRFPNLRFELLLPLLDSDDHILRRALLPATLKASADRFYEVCGKSYSGYQLADKLAVWLPSAPPDHYDAFISYSHVPEFDEPFAERLADCLDAQSPALSTFLDKRSSRLGSDLDTVCLLAIANSRVVVPVVTWNALRRLTALTADSPINYVLLEWSFLLLQHEHGAVALPIFIGASNTDGTADPTVDLFKARPPRASDDGWGNALDGEGNLIPQLELDVFSRAPDVVVNSVASSLEGFYKKHGLQPPAEIRTRTVRDVVKGIAKVWGQSLSSGHAWSAHMLSMADEWGLEEAAALQVAKRAREGDNKVPKLLGKQLPAKPANEGHTDDAIKSMLQEMREIRKGQEELVQIVAHSLDEAHREMGLRVDALIKEAQDGNMLLKSGLASLQRDTLKPLQQEISEMAERLRQSQCDEALAQDLVQKVGCKLKIALEETTGAHIRELLTKVADLLPKESDHGDAVATSLEAVLRQLGEMNSKLDRIELSTEQALRLLRAQSCMLSTMLQCVDKLVPKLIGFLPAEIFGEAGTKAWYATKIKRPREWFQRKVRLFFFDPIHYSLAPTNKDGNGDPQGFELAFPKEWVSKAVPFIKIGLTALKVAHTAGKLGGFPVPDIGSFVGDWLGSLLDEVSELKGEALEWMSSLTQDKALAKRLLEQVDAKCTSLLSGKLDDAVESLNEPPLGKQLEKPLHKSAADLRKLLDDIDSSWKAKTGLVLVTAEDGTSEWVLAEDKEYFYRHGKAAFGAATHNDTIGDGQRKSRPAKAQIQAKLKDALIDLFNRESLKSKLSAAESWFDKMGFESVQDMIGAKMRDEFIANLELKEGQQMLLMEHPLMRD